MRDLNNETFDNEWAKVVNWNIFILKFQRYTYNNYDVCLEPYKDNT